MQDAANYAPIINALLASYIPWQMPLDPLPSVFTQPE
jgi:hypothetical protein